MIGIYIFSLLGFVRDRSVEFLLEQFWTVAVLVFDRYDFSAGTSWFSVLDGCAAMHVYTCIETGTHESTISNQ